ncbi:putative Xaa-Pro aminopeptidase P [Beauveria bassiana]|nr:putative Xaa-Pro aminopeptidase P [Beauveria bassiana]
MDRVNTTPRLAELRKLMKENNISAYIVPSGDSHASEYAADCFNRREYISGFDGSAGIAVVSEEAAALSTDGRYFNQATQQLDDNWRLIKFGIPEEITWQDWVAEQCKDGKTAGVDPTLLTPAVAKKLTETIQKAGGSGLVAITKNLIDIIWGNERPTIPTNKVFIHPDKYAGKTVKDKLAELREEITKKKATGLYVTALDEVAWLFNLRGNDVEYNPVFYCYASITHREAILYVEESKVNQSVREHLTTNEVKVKPYSSFFADVEGASDGKYLITDTASWAVKTAIGSEDNVEEVKSSITDAKSVKNEVELEGMRACHIRDGAALTSYYAWLENQLIEKKASIDEAQAADMLMEFRKKQDLFVGESFATISCTGPK